MATKKKPQGKFAAGKVEAPRKVTINGETHYLVYVTPDEAKGLKKAGGSGQAGPKGIPAFPRGSVSKDKVDKATGAKSAPAKSTTKTVTNTGSRGSEKKAAPAPKDRDDRQPTPAPKSTPAPAPRDRDDRQPTPAPKSTPAPAPRNDGPTAAEKAAAAAKVKALADKAIRDQIESDRAAQLARDQKQLAEDKLNAEKSIAAMARLEGKPVYAGLDTRTDETPTAPVFTPNIMDAQTDDDLGLTSSPLAGTAATTATTATAATPVTPVAPGVTASGVASVVNPPVVTDPKVATGNYKPTIDPKTGAVTDRLGNPVVTNAKGYGYFDPITGLAVTPWTDSINGGGPGYGGAALGSGGGAALDTNKDNYISEAEIAAGKAKGLELEQNGWSKFGTGLGITPLGSGIDPTGIAGFADSGILGFARKLGAPGYVRPDSSIAPGQELNKWWEADKNALGFAYGTQDEISQRRADAVRAAAVPERNSDNDNGPVAPTVPTVTTPPNYTANAQQAFACRSQTRTTTLLILCRWRILQTHRTKNCLRTEILDPH
jgi:hypothetical protein